MANLRIIPLGGLGEVGRNMMLFEYGRNILIVDAGVMFPENDMRGIDLVIPDFQYLRDKTELVRGIVITHGHEDHIGALPYLLELVDVPVYATRLPCALIENRLKRAGYKGEVDLQTVNEGDEISVGPFDIEFLATSHSIPDGVSLAINTPVGLIVHSSDFKFDYTPVHGKGADFGRLAELGRQGVLALLSDSTGAERRGFTPSETVIEGEFDRIFSEAEGRIIVTTFASLLSRIQQVVNAAVKHSRKVALAGYSMLENARIAQELGYLEIPAGVLVDLKHIRKYKPSELVLLTTGSQGQPEAALARMASGRHRDIEVVPGDTVILSSQPIPGNEEEVARVINALLLRGADVIYPPLAQVHVSGHASQGEQKLLLSLTKPRFFVPIHGEPRHLYAHARLAREMGLPTDRIVLLQNGDALEFDKDGKVEHQRAVTSGSYIFVDGSGVGDIGPVVLHDREILSGNGFVIAVVQWDKEQGTLVTDPELISRGFIYLRESSDLLQEAGVRVRNALENNGKLRGRRAVGEAVKQTLGKFFYEETRRRPMVIPVVTET